MYTISKHKICEILNVLSNSSAMVLERITQHEPSSPVSELAFFSPSSAPWPVMGEKRRGMITDHFGTISGM